MNYVLVEVEMKEKVIEPASNYKLIHILLIAVEKVLKWEHELDVSLFTEGEHKRGYINCKWEHIELKTPAIRVRHRFSTKLLLGILVFLGWTVMITL